MTLTEETIKNLALIEIDKILRTRGTSLQNFEDLPNPIGSDATDEQNRLIIDELAYDRFEMEAQLQNYMSSLLTASRELYST